MRLARAAGIDAADARLIDSDGIPVALIRRFDRRDEEAGFCTCRPRRCWARSRGSGRARLHGIVDALRVRGAAAQQDIEELWRRIAFSILITNVDDHLLNHGFLHAGHGQWRLAPAFDLNPFPDRVRELKTWISPRRGPGGDNRRAALGRSVFQDFAARAKEVAAQVENVVAGWRDEGRSLGMTDAELEPFASAFEHSERDAARRI